MHFCDHSRFTSKIVDRRLAHNRHIQIYLQVATCVKYSIYVDSVPGFKDQYTSLCVCIEQTSLIDSFRYYLFIWKFKFSDRNFSQHRPPIDRLIPNRLSAIKSIYWTKCYLIAFKSYTRSVMWPRFLCCCTRTRWKSHKLAL